MSSKKSDIINEDLSDEEKDLDNEEEKEETSDDDMKVDTTKTIIQEDNPVVNPTESIAQEGNIPPLVEEEWEMVSKDTSKGPSPFITWEELEKMPEAKVWFDAQKIRRENPCIMRNPNKYYWDIGKLEGHNYDIMIHLIDGVVKESMDVMSYSLLFHNIILANGGNPLNPENFKTDEGVNDGICHFYFDGKETKDGIRPAIHIASFEVLHKFLKCQMEVHEDEDRREMDRLWPGVVGREWNELGINIQKRFLDIAEEISKDETTDRLLAIGHLAEILKVQALVYLMTARLAWILGKKNIVEGDKVDEWYEQNSIHESEI